MSRHFGAFFGKLNPSEAFEKAAARDHASITKLIEDRSGPGATLKPRCFLQGSHTQQTAIYTINDVDIVALCALWQPGSGTAVRSGRRWDRDAIFDTIAGALLKEKRYKDRVRYGANSMCIKVEGDVKVEILPVVYKQGNSDFEKEPFRLYRPENNHWEDGFAREHRRHLSQKNAKEKTSGNFIPAIKILKHIRSRYGINAASFHLECLLYSLPDSTFTGGAADYVARVIHRIAETSPSDWYKRRVLTPCGDRDIFTKAEWDSASWVAFHTLLTKIDRVTQGAITIPSESRAIECWQTVLGGDFFPAKVAA